MINETAKTTVLLDGKQAEEALKKLQVEGKELRQEMERLKKANDLAGFEKVRKEADANTKAQKALTKELFSLEKVLNNLSGSSMNQLKTAQRAITSELNKMTRGTQEYINKSKQLEQVNGEIAKVKTQLHGAGGAGQSAWDKIGMAATKFMGVAAAAWGVLKSGEAIFKSTGDSADKFERNLKGISNSFEYLKSAIANLDFTNFMARMKMAFEGGKDYANTMDMLGDKTVALGFKEATAAKQIEELRKQAYAANKTDEEKIQIIETILKKEDELEKIRTDIKKQAYEAEVKRVADLRNLNEIALLSFIKQEGQTLSIYEEGVRRRDELKKMELELMSLQNRNSGSNAVGSVMPASTKTKEDEERILLLSKQILQYKQSVGGLIELVNNLGDVTDPERQAIVASYKEMTAAEISADVNSRRLYQRKEGMIDEFLKKKEKEKEANDPYKLSLGFVEEEFAQYRLYTMQQYTQGKISQDQYSEDMLANETALLLAKKALLINYKMSVTEINEAIAKKEVDILNKTLSEKEKADKEYFDTKLKLLQDEEEEIWQKAQDEEDLLKERMAAGQAMAEQYGTQIGSIVGTFIANQQEGQAAFAQGMISMAFQALRAMVKIWVPQIFGSQVSTKGFLGIPAATILSGMLYGLVSAAEAVVSKKITANQRASGKYDVIGAEDGRAYSVNYAGDMKTGIYSTPTLVGERGDEIVIDGATTRNLMVNFPEILPTIRAAMVPQRASGNLKASSALAANSKLEKLIERQLAVTDRQSAVISTLTRRLNKGINASMSYSNLKDGLDKGQAAENLGSKI